MPAAETTAHPPAAARGVGVACYDPREDASFTPSDPTSGFARHPAETVAIQALRSAEPPVAAPSAVAAIVAAAKAKTALAGPTGWDAILETRNMLVDFINAQAAVAEGGDVSHLQPAEKLLDDLDLQLGDSACPARVQIAHALRLNDEGFDVGELLPPLLKAAAEEYGDGRGESPPPAPSIKDPGAIARWNAVRDAYLAAEAESERASDIEGEKHDSEDLKQVYALHEDVHRGWRMCRQVLLATPAPHWAALALKAKAVIGYVDNCRWVRAARDFIDAAEKIGSVDPKRADLIDVLKARGHAEQIAYYAAHRPDGYADYACGMGQIAQMVTEIEGLVTESRDLARTDARLGAISAHVIGAVWFNEIPGHDRLGSVEALDEEFSEVIRTFNRLDEKQVSGDGLTAEEQAEYDKADRRLDEIQDGAFSEPPVTRGGVAFQLIVAASMIDRVYGGSTEQIRSTASANIRTALANAIRALGLPFDYRAAQYFMGPQLDDLDGRDRGGLAK